MRVSEDIKTPVSPFESVVACGELGLKSEPESDSGLPLGLPLEAPAPDDGSVRGVAVIVCDVSSGTGTGAPCSIPFGPCVMPGGRLMV